MHIWRIENVVRQLAQDSLSEWDKARYLLGTFLVPIVTAYGAALLREGPSRQYSSTIVTGISLFLELLVNVVGVILIFNVHAKGSGAQGFLDKAICIGLPAAIRTLVIGWCGLGALVLLVALGAESTWFAMAMEQFTPLAALFMAIYFNVLYFWFMYRGFSLFNEGPIH